MYKICECLAECSAERVLGRMLTGGKNSEEACALSQARLPPRRLLFCAVLCCTPYPRSRLLVSVASKYAEKIEEEVDKVEIECQSTNQSELLTTLICRAVLQKEVA